MMIKNDGGYAFPVYTGNREHWEFGMTLRDWFAGRVLSAWPVSERTDTASDLAAMCYGVADAMIAARDK